jgi:hypothetical protein
MIYLVSISIASILANALLAFKYFKGLKENEELKVKVKTLTDFAEELSVKLLKEVEEKKVVKAVAVEVVEEKVTTLEDKSEEPKAAPAKRRGRRKKPNNNKTI